MAPWLALSLAFTFGVGLFGGGFNSYYLPMVAAVLTIIGYSVNDTIVVFDRVRENLRSMRRDALDEVVNRSVNQTLGRTITTSALTQLVVVAMLALRRRRVGARWTNSFAPSCRRAAR